MFPTPNTKVEDPVRSRFWPTREELQRIYVKISRRSLHKPSWCPGAELAGNVSAPFL